MHLSLRGISVQFSLSVMSDFLRPHESQHTRPPCPTNSQSLLKPMSIESVMPSSHLILCRPLLFLAPIPPSIRVFSSESTLCMRWPNYSSQAPLLSSSSPVSIVSGAWSGWERLRDAPPRAGRAVFTCQPVVLCVSSGEDPAHFLLFFSLFQESPYCSP